MQPEPRSPPNDFSQSHKSPKPASKKPKLATSSFCATCVTPPQAKRSTKLPLSSSSMRIARLRLRNWFGRAICTDDELPLLFLQFGMRPVPQDPARKRIAHRDKPNR